MPSFRNSADKAEKAARETFENNTSKSLGTVRNVKAGLTRFDEYLKREKAGFLEDFKTSPLTMDQRGIVKDFLEYRATKDLTQSTIDNDRQSIQRMTRERFERVQAKQSRGEKAEHIRVYTREQTQEIVERQSDRNALATEIASYSGLRAEELLTIARPNEQPAHIRDCASQRWSEHRFANREGTVYTVQGKGGLIREVLISKQLSDRLEERRLEFSERSIDRGILHEQRYDLGGGQAWSQSFSSASSRWLGFSHGAHGLRHTFCSDRMDELKQAGFSREDAVGIIAQEMGHFRSKITECYIR